jgi:ABC-type microcin C transport system duplicated ATPase subunit YejF
MKLISPPGKIMGGQILFYENGKCTSLLTLPESELTGYRGNRIAMIFQEPMSSLNPVFTCGRQVEEALVTHQELSKKECTGKNHGLVFKSAAR